MIFLTLSRSLLISGCAALFLSSCSDPLSDYSDTDIVALRKGFKTNLIKEESEDYPAPESPPMIFDLVSYEGEKGSLSAYVSPDPEDGKKSPVVIWLVGGFSNSISEIAWETMERDNDQSGSTFRKAGLLMMYPSFRGGNENPGFKEGILGEVDDVLAAVDYLESLDYIDPDRIYLGGHSTGGTLALLTVASAPEKTFRSVFSLGPIDYVDGYGQEILPYDVNVTEERIVRAPILVLQHITTPTFMFEGEGGNYEPLLQMEKAGKMNGNLSFFPLKGAGHFNIIAPVSELIANKILKDNDKESTIKISGEEVAASIEMRMPPPRSPYPEGDPRMGRIYFEYALYLPEKAEESDLLKTVEDIVRSDFPELNWMKDSDTEFSGKQDVYVQLETEVAEMYAPPETESLQYSGFGFSEEEAEELQKTEHAIRIWFRHPGAEALEGLKSADKLLVKLSEKFGGFLWDEITRQVFTREAWIETRIGTWSDGLPDCVDHVAMHAYRNGDHIRAITLGMEKFGLPDVLMSEIPDNANTGRGNLINTVCQLLIEGSVIANPDSFPIDLRSIRHKGFREVQLEGVVGDGTGKGTVALKIGPWDPGDPSNDLIEIYPFDSGGSDFFAAQHTMVSEIFGFKDEVQFIDHDNSELQAASDRAREKLPALRKKFNEGLGVGENLLIKVPFASEDGSDEWMWVGVQKWADDGTIRGLLQSSPHFVPELSAGQEVEVQEKDIFDYILNFEDGTQEGGETSEVIEKLKGGDAEQD